MSAALIIQVTIYDDETGIVAEQTITHSGTQYHWEVTKMFDVLGATVAKKIDPNYEV